MVNERSLAINKALVKIFDELLEKGDWHSTLFLKVSGQRILKLREKAQALLDGALQDSAPLEEVFDTTGYILVYVSLFHMGGGSPKDWQGRLKSLSGYAVSRPIYEKEEHVQAVIRNKDSPENEAYVAVWIKEDQVLSRTGERAKKDSFGHPLLVLRSEALKNARIEFFVHQGTIYTYDGSRLFLKEA